MSWFKLIIRQCLKAFDLHITRHSHLVASQAATKISTIGARRKKIMEAHGINVVIDVGANTGQYATNLRSSGFTGKIISFEPLPQAYSILQHQAAGDDLWLTHNTALGNADEQRNIHIAGNLESSSFLPMTTRHIDIYPESEYVGDQMVPIARLDNLIKGLLCPNDHVLLKLDVQGYELDVLKGSVYALHYIDLVETEMCIAPLYTCQPLPFNTMEFLDHASFDLISLDNGQVDIETGHLLWVDGFFARRNI